MWPNPQFPGDLVLFTEEICNGELQFLCSESTARKTIFSFSGRPDKMVFPKKLRWNMIFLVLLGKMIFLFSENMILHLRWKMKADLSLKNTRKYIFFKLSEKIVFPKGPRQHMIFLALSWKMAFFSRNQYFFPGHKARNDPSQEIHVNMTFFVYTYGC